MNSNSLVEQYLGHSLEQVPKQVVIVNGVTRSGTSITGKLCSTLNGVEYEFEPGFPIYIPVIAQAGLMDMSFAHQFMRKYANEISITRMLGRNVNMRSTDESNILNSISGKELAFRWKKLLTRKDAIQYSKRNRNILIMKITNFHNYYEFLFQSFKNCKVIHIVRNGFDVALSITKKDWYREGHLKSPEYFNLSKVVSHKQTKKKYTVPFHIPPEEAFLFSQATPFEKSLLSWCVLMEKNKSEIRRLKLNKTNYLELKYEDLLAKPQETTDRLCQFIRTTKTSFTNPTLKTLHREKLNTKPQYPLRSTNRSLLLRTNQLLEEYGYPTHPIR